MRKNNALFTYLDSLPININLKRLIQYLNLPNASDVDELCIFGAGAKGINLYYQLEKYSIPVMSFCDNDTQKYGYLIENHYCIPFEYLEKDKEHVLVVVSNAKHKNDIIQQLQSANFKFITTDDVVLNCLCKLFDCGDDGTRNDTKFKNSMSWLCTRNVTDIGLEKSDENLANKIIRKYNKIFYDFYMRNPT